ncbi:MAG: 23S rRNA (guanosine(2251)-2'-O)-methyltransferase RlmB [Prolixibacteraceae bacterium]|jgi:23S rRNA (guanosine2251-2'-O)-methyltransferase|nr:23S rRNA (guanosine(2251)-2'-O)-methyltransferase RlmB [Prolixibacteraceae bacterium]
MDNNKYGRKKQPDSNNFIFGIRTTIEAINSGKTIDKILIKQGLQSELYKELQDLIKTHDINSQMVPEQKLNRVTRKNHQGIIAFVSPVPFYDIDEIITRTYENGDSPFILYLDQITDVRNFGAIVRSAECAGVHAIVVPEKGSAQINADALKTSAGALHHIPVCKVKSGHQTLHSMKQNGIKLFAATEKAETIYSAADYQTPCAIIMGSEESGISDENIRLADELVKIPILGKIGSLNVSVATGIVLFEVVKQRTRI